ncbi:HTTM domain-containing protein [Natrialba asiatica]|uniref:HTTM domain-containing protein n=1 Tax=Natrialba asiatica (strain ATCC 700177 / DSM 12278 / JCM 9576 / FERM P-10747 / NBRC 102637 / 172P1) TaxID=29540 RepID=M0AX79_NATA1|nr:HTTM domain-containing protein [Natrialba asiatica]ELZ03105.1 HTTM domain-containing protein [Natrialba asiatica DSM 12278]
MPSRSDAGPRSRRRTADGDPLSEFIEPRLGIDVRALAVFRIALGMVLLADLLTLRLPGLVTFYSDSGVFPQSTLAETYPAFEAWSLHALSGAPWFQGLLFAVAGVFASLLLVGYRTRLAVTGSLVLFASLLARNPLLVNGGDTILLTFLVLGLVLPLGTRWSLDARRGSRRPERSGSTDTRTVSFATATILVHFGCIYGTNAVRKFQSDPWTSGVAVRQIFHLEQYLTPLGSALSASAALLTAVNWGWTALLSGSVLLLVLTGRARIALVAGFVTAHLGMAATMRLGVFPFVMIAGLLLFLPSSCWDRLERFLAATELGQRAGAGLPIGDGGGPDGDSSASHRRSSPSEGVTVRRCVRAGGTVLVACFLVSSVLWQVAALGVGIPLVDSLDQDGEDDGEIGSWSFFAPNPPDSYSWYTVEATLESGETIGVFPRGHDGVRLDRPPDGTTAYPSTLWMRYGTDVRYADDTYYEPAAEFSCAHFDRRVDAVTIAHVGQPVGPDGPAGEPERQERITYAC